MTTPTMTEPPVRRGSDYAVLSRRVAEAGLLARRPGGYAVRIVLTLGAFLAGWAVLVAVGDSWAQLLVAVGMAVATTQVAFLGHDAGHRQMFRRRGHSEAAGLVAGNLAVGISYGWWVDKHNRHHANPNHEDKDPDVGAGALVWTPSRRRRPAGSPAGWPAGRRAVLPDAAARGAVDCTWRASGAAPSRARCTRRRARGRRCWSAHLVGYLALLFAVLSPGKALLFVAVHQGLFGALPGLRVRPQPQGHADARRRRRPDFLRKQVLTSRNIRGGRLVDWRSAGSTTRSSTTSSRACPAPTCAGRSRSSRAYCAEHGIPYAETGLVESYRQALAHLHEVGRPLRDR